MGLRSTITIICAAPFFLGTLFFGWYWYEFYWRWRDCFNSEGNCFVADEGVVYHQQNEVMIVPATVCLGIAIAALLFGFFVGRRANPSEAKLL